MIKYPSISVITAFLLVVLRTWVAATSPLLLDTLPLRLFEKKDWPCTAVKAKKKR